MLFRIINSSTTRTGISLTGLALKGGQPQVLLQKCVRVQRSISHVASSGFGWPGLTAAQSGIQSSASLCSWLGFRASSGLRIQDLGVQGLGGFRVQSTARLSCVPASASAFPKDSCVTNISMLEGLNNFMRSRPSTPY